MLFKNFLFLIFTCAILLSCDSGTEPNSNSVQGKFVTEEGVAIEDALVRVFEIKPLDTLAMRLRRDYKDVGCDISDATEFDHRFYGTPLAEGRTGADGKFSFKNLSGGPYHISVTHPEYSWRYIYRKSGDVGTVTTKPILEIKGSLSGSVVWDKADQDYVVRGNAIINGESLTIKKGVRIRFGNQQHLMIHSKHISIIGEINAPVWITADSDSAQQSFFSGIQFNNATGIIERVACSYGVTPLQFINSSCIVDKSYFTNNQTGLGFTNCDSLILKNSIAYNNTQSFLKVENTSLKVLSSVAFLNIWGIECRNSSKAFLDNCYIQAQDKAVYISENSEVEANYSELSASDDAIYLIGGCKTFLKDCLLKGNPPLYITFRPSGGDIRQNSVNIEHSNVYHSVPAIHINANTSLILKDTYLEHAQTRAEYEMLIEENSPFKDITIVNLNPQFVPLHPIGLRL